MYVFTTAAEKCSKENLLNIFIDDGKKGTLHLSTIIYFFIRLNYNQLFIVCFYTSFKTITFDVCSECSITIIGYFQ